MQIHFLRALPLKKTVYWSAHRAAHLLTERYHQRSDIGAAAWSQESLATFEVYAAKAVNTVETVLGKAIDCLHAEGFQRAMKKLRIPL
eukprot:5307965-Amphidinium_carterae.2